MNELKTININNSDVSVKEFKGQRVVTFKDIDTVHQRPDGTAKRNFNENKNKFIENEDYYFVRPKDIQPYEIRTSEINNSGTYLITESGYLMLVKSFTDELAWKVQRQLVNTYFKIRQQQSQSKVPFTEIVQSIDIVANSLKVNDASKLLMYDKLYNSYGVSTEFLPKYENNGSRELKSATELLKRINSNIKTAVFNQLLIKNGYLEERTRKSTKSDELRYFKALTEKGLQYGENLISPRNQREVQPCYYADKFQELYNLVNEKAGVLA